MSSDGGRHECLHTVLMRSNGTHLQKPADAWFLSAETMCANCFASPHQKGIS